MRRLAATALVLAALGCAHSPPKSAPGPATPATIDKLMKTPQAEWRLAVLGPYQEYLLPPNRLDPAVQECSDRFAASGSAKIHFVREEKATRFASGELLSPFRTWVTQPISVELLACLETALAPLPNRPGIDITLPPGPPPGGWVMPDWEQPARSVIRPHFLHVIALTLRRPKFVADKLRALQDLVDRNEIASAQSVLDEIRQVDRIGPGTTQAEGFIACRTHHRGSLLHALDGLDSENRLALRKRCGDDFEQTLRPPTTSDE